MSGIDDQLRNALETAYAYLNRRDRTTHELREHLHRHLSGTTAADRAIGVLQEQGYLDDARYARLFAEDKRGLEHWGDERIRRALEARGVARELIDDALTPTAGESELDRALSLLARRFPGGPPRERRDRDRALGILVRKGYDVELALDALAAYARHSRDTTVR